MKFAKIMALLLCLLFGAFDDAGAQPAIDRPQDSNMKAGQLFSVGITPVGKRIEVFVAGKKSASIDFLNLHLTATLRVGGKSWSFRARDAG